MHLAVMLACPKRVTEPWATPRRVDEPRLPAFARRVVGREALGARTSLPHPAPKSASVRGAAGDVSVPAAAPACANSDADGVRRPCVSKGVNVPRSRFQAATLTVYCHAGEVHGGWALPTSSMQAYVEAVVVREPWAPLPHRGERPRGFVEPWATPVAPCLRAQGGARWAACACRSPTVLHARTAFVMRRSRG